MEVNIYIFGSLADTLGQRTCTLKLPDNTSVRGALVLLEERYPELAARKIHFATAVNHEYVGPDHQLDHGDELALIPPVSGG